MKRSKSLDALLNYFPVIELPLNFTEETISVYSKENKPLPDALIDLYISKWENEIDEYTEIIPCALITENEDFISLVYYKASLLRYDYFLISIDRSESLISKKSIAGTIVDGDIVKQSVARIDQDLIIHIMVGHLTNNNQIDPSQNLGFTMEIMPSGEIQFFDDDNQN
jgi:hypothetical protein